MSCDHPACFRSIGIRHDFIKTARFSHAPRKLSRNLYFIPQLGSNRQTPLISLRIVSLGRTVVFRESERGIISCRFVSPG